MPLPIKARIAITMKLSAARIRRLLKNLNIAPSTDSFEPYIDLVIQIFLNNVVPHGINDLIERRNRIHTTRPGFRHKNIFIILEHLIVRRTYELPEPQIEIFLPSNAPPYGFKNGWRRPAFARYGLLKVRIDLFIAHIHARIVRDLTLDQIIIDQLLDESFVVLNRFLSKPLTDFPLLAEVAARNDVAFDDSHDSVDHLG